jgi:hypothetical protein
MFGHKREEATSGCREEHNDASPQIYYDDQMQEDEVAGHVPCME